MEYDNSAIEKIRNNLIKNGKTLSIAESVTAGHLQAAISAAQNASEFFQGGITLYNMGQKTRHLHIDPVKAEKTNCVAQWISDQIGVRVCDMFLSDYGIGITGYAGRVPEKNVHDVYAYVSVSFNRQIIVATKIETHLKEGIAAQVDFANQALNLFSNYLDGVYSV